MTGKLEVDAIADISKDPTSAEDAIHSVHLGHIPLRDVAVERFRTHKHAIHDSHAGHIPLREVACKRFRSEEHIIHSVDPFSILGAVSGGD